VKSTFYRDNLKMVISFQHLFFMFILYETNGLLQIMLLIY